MRVAVSSGGRFHAFDLARELERRGYLANLYTAYPRFKVDIVSPEKVRSSPWLMGPTMLAARYGLGSLRDRLNVAAIRRFDNFVANTIEPCDVFHALSSYAITSHRTARQRFGALTVCDRGSTHILWQQRILAEEHERLGIEFGGFDRRIVERELEEYSYCDLIAVPSEFARRTFIDQGISPDKVVVNPLGVDLEAFTPEPARDIDAPFRVLFAGAISVRKGIATLLEAFFSPARIAGAELWMVGATEPAARKILGKFDGYRHFGAVSRRELPRLYRAASVLVLPSVEDGFGLVMAQAMACGTPVIASSNTGARDLFGDGVEGFIVPPRNARILREKMLELRDDRDRNREMSRAALRKVRSIGGWRSYGERTISIYQAALGARARAA